MDNYFNGIKIGDRVWSIRYGWGTVVELKLNTLYQICVRFDNKDGYVRFDKKDGITSFTLDGKYALEDNMPTLFWDEIKFELPQKPLPKLEVDTKVIVWSSCTPSCKEKRYFSHFHQNGRIGVFSCGATSWSSSPNDASFWDNWELA